MLVVGSNTTTLNKIRLTMIVPYKIAVLEPNTEPNPSLPTVAVTVLPKAMAVLSEPADVQADPATLCDSRINPSTGV
jgi:hypothetical protein